MQHCRHVSAVDGTHARSRGWSGSLASNSYIDDVLVGSHTFGLFTVMVATENNSIIVARCAQLLGLDITAIARVAMHGFMAT